jgi:hypothetical protein
VLLIHQLPPRPDYLRVKVRRKLARLGAVVLKNTVYALPWSEEAVEDFQWLSREIRAEGGEAVVCAASLLDPKADGELAGRVPGAAVARRPGAPRRASAAAAKDRVWVTRRGVGVDRIASAWLIRRFIDPEARFRFVAARGHRPRTGELRFDMYEGEYTHEGDRCTFETLLRHFRLTAPVLRRLGEMVHDIDCKDEKFGRPGTGELERGIGRIARSRRGDAARLAAGGKLLDRLYAAGARRR